VVRTALGRHCVGHVDSREDTRRRTTISMTHVLAFVHCRLTDSGRLAHVLNRTFAAVDGRAQSDSELFW
jgi:hypothetical protein